MSPVELHLTHGDTTAVVDRLTSFAVGYTDTGELRYFDATCDMRRVPNDGVQLLQDLRRGLTAAAVSGATRIAEAYVLTVHSKGNELRINAGDWPWPDDVAQPDDRSST